MRMRLMGFMSLVVALTVPASGALGMTEGLETFLRSVEAATAITVPLRADGELDAQLATGQLRSDLVMVVRPPSDMYIELRKGPRKALLLTSAGTAFRLHSEDGKAEKFAEDAAFADSDFTREDLEPFQLARYKTWLIADESAGEVTVTLMPKNSQYTMLVTTFDIEKKVPLKTLYYQDTLSNLVKMRRESDYTLVGRKWMPTAISMENFKFRTTTTLRLKWTQDAAFPPELFDPAFLSRSFALAPQPAPAGAQATQ
jgi:hypothetical protein